LGWPVGGVPGVLLQGQSFRCVISGLGCGRGVRMARMCLKRGAARLPRVMIQVLTPLSRHPGTALTAPVPSSWLAGCIRRHLPAGTVPDPVSVRAALEGRLTDTRKPRGKRHPLPSLVSVVVAGVASAGGGPLAAAQAAAGWDQEVLAAHGCRVSPRTGLRVAPSASMLDRLGKLLDADEFEAALSACVAAAALDPAIPAAYAAHRAGERRAREEKRKKRKRKDVLRSSGRHGTAGARRRRALRWGRPPGTDAPP
jgi:hypothetical protein